MASQKHARLREGSRELISYGVFGVLTTVINYVVYFVCITLFDCNYVISNGIAWVLAVVFAFVTNKLYVFHSLSWDFKTTFRQCWQFFSARIFSLLVETALLWLLIEQFQGDERIVKIFTNIVVIVINYVISKIIIFRKKAELTKRFEIKQRYFL